MISWTNSIVFEFGYGILIALACNNRHRPSRPLAITMFFLGIAVWLGIGLDPDLSITSGAHLSVYQWRGFLWGIPAGLIVASLTLGTSGVRIRQHSSLRSLAKLGDASYSLYLVHLFVMRTVTLILRPLAGIMGIFYPVAYLAVFLVAAVAAAFVSYHALERPAERAWRHGLEALLGGRRPTLAGKQLS